MRGQHLFRKITQSSLVIAVLCCTAVASAFTLTNVSVVNVTPSTFSVVWATSVPSYPAISVYADPGGTNSLAGQVCTEYYPLHTGSPTAGNAYERRLNQAALRTKSFDMGSAYVRVSGCEPATTYYFRLTSTNLTGEQVIWPSAGPLPSVTTAREDSFVLQSRQLVISLPGVDPSGTIVVLGNPNTPSRLAAVAGDGAAFNQVFFNLTDVLDPVGETNYVQLGNQEFTATVLGSSPVSAPQTFSIYFSTDFLVGSGSEFFYNQYVALLLGSAVLRAGDSGDIPITTYASGLTNVSFLLPLPTNRFSALSLQALAPEVTSATLQNAGPDLLLARISTAPGQPITGNELVAQLNFTTVPNQPSAFIPLVPQSIQGLSVSGDTVLNIAAQRGRLTVIGTQPLLEAVLEPDNNRQLNLYGIPWASYEIQSSAFLGSAGTWVDVLRVALTNLVVSFPAPQSDNPTVFYRAYQFTADPPILQAMLSGPDQVLLAYGVPSRSYQVQYASNVSGTVSWYPLLSYTLTNSFRYLPVGPPTNPAIFYRLQRQ